MCSSTSCARHHQNPLHAICKPHLSIPSVVLDSPFDHALLPSSPTTTTMPLPLPPTTIIIALLFLLLATSPLLMSTASWSAHRSPYQLRPPMMTTTTTPSSSAPPKTPRTRKRKLTLNADVPTNSPPTPPTPPLPPSTAYSRGPPHGPETHRQSPQSLPLPCPSSLCLDGRPTCPLGRARRRRSRSRCWKGGVCCPRCRLLRGGDGAVGGGSLGSRGKGGGSRRRRLRWGGDGRVVGVGGGSGVDVSCVVLEVLCTRGRNEQGVE